LDKVSQAYGGISQSKIDFNDYDREIINRIPVTLKGEAKGR
jgi:hypothetical protein